MDRIIEICSVRQAWEEILLILGADYEHVQFMQSHQDIEYEVRPLADLYKMILGHGDFEVSEFSLSNHAMFRDKGDNWLTAIPVFPSRAFRHSTIIVKKDSPLEDFSQLRGKRVGIVEYSMTAAVWTRGHMFEDYGIHWC
jgi:4,5-dihydroxyphthalate decarboxylase